MSDPFDDDPFEREVDELLRSRSCEASPSPDGRARIDSKIRRRARRQRVVAGLGALIVVAFIGVGLAWSQGDDDRSTVEFTNEKDPLDEVLADAVLADTAELMKVLSLEQVLVMSDQTDRAEQAWMNAVVLADALEISTSELDDPGRVLLADASSDVQVYFDELSQTREQYLAGTTSASALQFQYAATTSTIAEVFDAAAIETPESSTAFDQVTWLAFGLGGVAHQQAILTRVLFSPDRRFGVDGGDYETFLEAGDMGEEWILRWDQNASSDLQVRFRNESAAAELRDAEAMTAAAAVAGTQGTSIEVDPDQWLGAAVAQLNMLTDLLDSVLAEARG